MEAEPGDMTRTRSSAVPFEVRPGTSAGKQRSCLDDRGCYWGPLAVLQPSRCAMDNSITLNISGIYGLLGACLSCTI